MAALRRLLLGLMLVCAGALATPSPSIGPHFPIDIVVDTLAPQAQAITSSQRAVLRRGVSPVASWSAATDPFPSTILTPSRTSNGMLFDSAGKLTYAPNNWLLYSNTFTNAAWLNTTMTITNVNAVADPFGGTNATTLAAAGATSVIQQFTARDAATGLNTLWMRRRTGTGQISLIKPDGSNNYVTLTGTWQQVTSTSAQGGTYFYFGVQINTAGDAIDVYYGTSSKVTYETTPRTADQVITTSAAYYGPRIDYDPNTLAVKGLLIEEARTNQYLNSSDLTDANTVQHGTTKSTDGTLGPDGKSLMVKTLANAGGGFHEIYQSFSVTSGVSYASSIFVKKGNYRYVAISFEVTSGLNGFLAVFDLDNPSAATQSFSTGASSLTTYGIVNCGGGIYRIYVAGTAGASGTGYLLAHLVSGATIPTGTVEPANFGAAGTEYAYFFGAQLEVGAFPTSYIPTAASSVTRAADVVQFTGAALTALQGSAGAVIVQSKGFGLSGSRARIISTTSDSPLNVVLIGTSVTVDTYNAAIQILNSGSSVDPTLTARYGVTWSASGRSIAANGGVVGTDANQMHGGLTTQAWLGSQVGSSAWASGWYQSFAIYNQRLSDATLQAKSVVGASYAANDNGVRFAFANDNLPVKWRLAL